MIELIIAMISISVGLLIWTKVSDKKSAKKAKLPSFALAVTSAAMALYYAATVDINDNDIAQQEQAVVDRLPYARLDGALRILKDKGMSVNRIAVIHYEDFDWGHHECVGIVSEFGLKKIEKHEVGERGPGVFDRTKHVLNLPEMKDLDAVIVLAGSVYAETLQQSVVAEKPTPIVFADGIYCNDWDSADSKIKVVAGLKSAISETNLSNNRGRQQSLQELCKATGTWVIYK